MTMEKIQLILANIALLFMMHVILSILHERKHYINKTLIYTSQIIVVSITSICMLYFPIEFGDYRFDFRILPLMLLAFILGWKQTIPALIVVSLVRFSFGGEGALPGVIYGTMIPTIVAMIFSTVLNRNMTTLRYIIGTITVILSSDLFIIAVVPNGWEVFKDIFPLRFLFFTLSSYFIYLMIVENRKRISLQNKLQFYANHDPLTGLYNNRRFFEKLKEVNRPPNDTNYIAMVDIDYFKNINDQYGHLSGDKMLTAIAKILLSFASDNVIVGRYGGEEFIIHLNNMTPIEALNKLEEIRITIERTIFYTKDNKKVNLSVSIGFTNLIQTTNLKSSIDIADQELYKAKRDGRNQICTNIL